MPAAAGGEDEGFGRAVKETGDKHSFGSRAVERGARLFERNSSLTLHCDFPFRRASVALREFFFFLCPRKKINQSEISEISGRELVNFHNLTDR